MINWRNIWMGVLLGSCIVVLAACSAATAFGMAAEPRNQSPIGWDCYREGTATAIPPNMEVVRCQAHYPRNADGKRHIFCHLKETS